MKSPCQPPSSWWPMIQLVLVFVALVAQDPGGYVPLLQFDGRPGWSADSPQCVGQAGQTLSIAACAGWVPLRTQLRQTYSLAFELRGRDANATAMLSLSTPPKVGGTPEGRLPASR